MNQHSTSTEALSQRRSQEKNAQNSRGWAVATPLLAAFSRPTPSGAGGRYRPTCSTDVLAPSLAILQRKQSQSLNTKQGDQNDGSNSES
jgi:hypothetical protein